MSAATACARLTLKVSPRAVRTELVGLWPDGSLHLRRAALSVKGAANAAALALLAKRLRIGLRRISLLGDASSTKLVQIDGMALADVRACLAH